MSSHILIEIKSGPNLGRNVTDQPTLGRDSAGPEPYDWEGNTSHRNLDPYTGHPRTDDNLIDFSKGEYSATQIPNVKLIVLEDGGNFLLGHSDDVYKNVTLFLVENASRNIQKKQKHASCAVLLI